MQKYYKVMLKHFWNLSQVRNTESRLVYTNKFLSFSQLYFLSESIKQSSWLFFKETLFFLLDENTSRESMAKRALKILMEKQNFFIGRIGTYHTILKECYTTTWYNHTMILHVVLGIQTCQCHWKINCKQLRMLP